MSAPSSRRQREPDARLDRQRHAVDLDRLADDGAQPAEHLGRLARVVDAGQDDAELVAAEPGDGVARRGRTA